jgi:hypothetical protein
VLEENSAQIDPSGWALLADAYLGLGRVEDCLAFLNDIPAELQEQFRLSRVIALAALGEYAEAGRLLDGMLKAMERSDDARAPFVAAAHVFQGLHFGTVEMAAQAQRFNTIFFLNEYARIAGLLEGVKAQKAELYALRAMLALEEGDILPDPLAPRDEQGRPTPATAQRYFQAALDLRTPFAGDGIAAAYRRILDQQAAR